jgi:hypothetical protein
MMLLLPPMVSAGSFLFLSAPPQFLYFSSLTSPSRVYSQVISSITLSGDDIDFLTTASASSSSLPLGSTLLRARIHSLPSHGVLFFANPINSTATTVPTTHSNSTILLLNSSIPLHLSAPFTLFYQFTGDALFPFNDSSVVAMDSFQFSVEDTAHAISLPVTLAIQVQPSLGAISSSGAVIAVENELKSFKVPPSLSFVYSPAL